MEKTSDDGKKILLSGVKPTGRPHIGNYFGAMKQFVDLLNSGKYDCYFFLADYHALNLIQDAEEMRRNSIDLAIDYLAIGLDPDKSVLFKQSDISAHTELAWIFDTIVDIPYLARAHAFKDAVQKYNDATPARRSLVSKMEQLTNVNVGTFNYPVLMAADILLYDTDVVPVGQDQKQHVEYARDIALKFNRVFKTETLKLPEALILEDVAVVPGTDGRKMSKSYDNTIPLFSTREEIQRAVMSIVTDSYSDEILDEESANRGLKLTRQLQNPKEKGIPYHVYNIHKLLKPKSELGRLYEINKGKYKALKEALIEDLDALIKPMRERRAELATDERKVAKILAEGAAKAAEKAQAKLKKIKENIGVL